MRPSQYNYIKRSLVRASYNIHIDIKKILLFPFKLIWWGIKYSFLFVYWILKTMFLAEVCLILGCLYILYHSVRLIFKCCFSIDLHFGGKIHFLLKRFANNLLDLFHLKETDSKKLFVHNHVDHKQIDSFTKQSRAQQKHNETPNTPEQSSLELQADELLQYAAMCERYVQEQEYLEAFGEAKNE